VTTGREDGFLALLSLGFSGATSAPGTAKNCCSNCGSAPPALQSNQDNLPENILLAE